MDLFVVICLYETYVSDKIFDQDIEIKLYGINKIVWNKFTLNEIINDKIMFPKVYLKYLLSEYF